MAEQRNASVEAHKEVLSQLQKTNLELEQSYQQSQGVRHQANQTENTFRRAEQQIVEERNRLAEYEARMANKGDVNVQRFYTGLIEQIRSQFRDEQSAEALRQRKNDLD